MATDSDRPIKNASGRYDNVDFRKAAGYQYPPIKCSYNRRDVLLFVSRLATVLIHTAFLTRS